MPATYYIEKLLCFGLAKGLLEEDDVIFARNQLWTSWVWMLPVTP